MAKFNYTAYMAQNKTVNATNIVANNQVKVTFLNNYLKKDGDFVVVRFPYETTDDFDIETCHIVTLPGQKFPQHVECVKENNDVDTCPLCKDKQKITNRFLVKAVAYIVEGSEVKLVPVVWDRPFGYATELANKINEYGSLKGLLFKIKRNGSGTSTTYSTDIVLNKTIYKPEIYKEDFSSIEKLNPVKLLVRSIKKYLDATKTTTTTENQPTPTATIVNQPKKEVIVEQTPVQTEPVTPSVNSVSARRYTFDD